MAYDRNAYLVKHYGISAEEYAALAIEQGGVCKCCGAPPVNRDLHVDHDHRVAKAKVKVKREGDGWCAYTDRFSHTIVRDTKEFAVGLMKTWLLRKSIRGLICWKCNMLLLAAARHGYQGAAGALRSAANYLDGFAVKVVN